MNQSSNSTYAAFKLSKKGSLRLTSLNFNERITLVTMHLCPICNAGLLKLPILIHFWYVIASDKIPDRIMEVDYRFSVFMSLSASLHSAIIIVASQCPSKCAAELVS